MYYTTTKELRNTLLSFRVVAPTSWHNRVSFPPPSIPPVLVSLDAVADFVRDALVLRVFVLCVVIGGALGTAAAVTISLLVRVFNSRRRTAAPFDFSVVENCRDGSIRKGGVGGGTIQVSVL